MATWLKSAPPLPPSRLYKGPGSTTTTTSTPAPSSPGGAPVSSSDPGAATGATSGSGTSSGGSGASTGQDHQQAWLAALEAQAQSANAQAASQDIADQYQDAGAAADLAGGGDPYGTLTPTPTSQPTSLSRLGDTSQWAGYGSHLTGVQGAQLDQLPREGDNEVWVTVPVDKVVLNPNGAAQTRPLYSRGTGYRDNPAPSTPAVSRPSALPHTPGTAVHPTVGGAG